MNWLEELRAMMERASESSKATGAVVTYTTASGTAAMLQWITGIGAAIAVFAGLAATLILARLNWIRGENERIRGDILRKKLQGADIPLDEDE
jgi:hypothetical protein